ncbi:hypothetical protein Dda_3367 [Drechslerella dactyloides]|uniref:Uncharacterized protein n=1 Tax=Drechslerella dactyloides TaxID=74499 RepID=A0AAD6NK99_DREDA|nr:hypothetical protein Dda_3367 [Drechslerella dactyloides]
MINDQRKVGSITAARKIFGQWRGEKEESLSSSEIVSEVTNELQSSTSYSFRSTFSDKDAVVDILVVTGRRKAVELEVGIESDLDVELGIDFNLDTDIEVETDVTLETAVDLDVDTDFEIDLDREVNAELQLDVELGMEVEIDVDVESESENGDTLTLETVSSRFTAQLANPI